MLRHQRTVTTTWLCVNNNLQVIVISRKNGNVVPENLEISKKVNEEVARSQCVLQFLLRSLPLPTTNFFHITQKPDNSGGFLIRDHQDREDSLRAANNNAEICGEIWLLNVHTVIYCHTGLCTCVFLCLALGAPQDRSFDIRGKKVQKSRSPRYLHTISSFFSRGAKFKHL